MRAFIRLNVIVILGIIGLIVVGGMLVFAGGSPETAAFNFMQALAKKDLNGLTELTVLEGSDESLRDQWDYTLNDAGRNMVWTWQFGNTLQTGHDQASVEVFMWEYKGVGAGLIPEPFQLPMIKQDGRWVVDLLALNREFFPALPR